MAQPIYFDNFARELRANAAAAPWEAAGAAVQGVAGSIEQVLFQAQQQKEQDRARRLTASAALVSKFGFRKLGPDFTAQWEADSGVKFPKGPDGKPNVPESYEDEVSRHRSEFLKQHPDYEAKALGLGKAPMTEDEKNFTQQKIDALHERNRLTEIHYALEHDARMAALHKDDQRSQFVYNPQTHELDQVAPGEGMSYRDLNGAKAAVTAHTHRLDMRLKKAQITHLLRQSESGDIIDKGFAPALKVYLDKKADPADKAHALAMMQSIAKRNGEELPFSTPKEAASIWSWEGIKSMVGLGRSSTATAQDKPLTPEQEVEQWEKANP